jgi:hypothetical protein
MGFEEESDEEKRAFGEDLSPGLGKWKEAATFYLHTAILALCLIL